MISDIRERIAMQPWIFGLIAAVGVIVAIGYSIHSGASNLTDRPYLMNTFYSSDDGASYFAGEGTMFTEMFQRSPPAYRAFVYKCGGGNPFVAYLTRVPVDVLVRSAQERTEIDKQERDLNISDPHYSQIMDKLETRRHEMMNAMNRAVEIKRPGAANQWLRLNEPKGQEIMDHVKCPNGEPGIPAQLLP